MDEQYEVVAGVIVVLDDLVIELIYQLIVLKLALPEFIQEFLCAAFKLLSGKKWHGDKILANAS